MPDRKYVIYSEVVAWYGSLTVADAAGDAGLRNRLVHRIDVLRSPEGAGRVSQDAHVDYRVFGAVPLEIGRLTRDTTLLAWGRSFADSPFSWGRGNGWFAAGMAEMLRSLPPSHPARARIIAGYRRMMAALLRYQAPDGLWRQLIDRPESWTETSGSGMLAFAMKQYRFYMERPRARGDLHGEAPVLWTATALLR